MTSTQGGHVTPGFEPVRDAFETAFADYPDMGAALAVRHRGELVVDLWGGWADAANCRRWQEDTTSVVFSCTKGLMSILAAILVQEGRLDYDEPAARYWPEFAQAGKADISVRDVLAHRSGLSAPRHPLSLADVLDWEKVTAALAAQAPLWPPGSAHAYHTLTHGWLIGEVIRRITGKTVGQYFAEAVAGPLDADAWIGLPPGLEDRVAHLEVGPGLAAHVREQAQAPKPAGPDWPNLALTLGGAFEPELVGPDSGFNDPRVRAAEIPGAGAIATARALATIWSATIIETNGVRLVGDATLAGALQVLSEGPPIFDVPPPWARWATGFQLDSEGRRYLTSSGFGHDGAGGQVAFADPEAQVGFAYLTNQLEATGDLRATRVIDALREAL